MNARLEELDWCETPIGVISLRRRFERQVERDVYEVKIDDEFLMSSLFTVVEQELARLALAQVEGEDISVLVGGLGLGYTAKAALTDDRVTAVRVIEAVAPVIDWHRRDLLPDTTGLAADPRCELVHADFFEVLANGATDRRHDAVLLDIDHSPSNLLHHSHAPFYRADGLARLGDFLTPDGVFGLWSDDPPEAVFEAALADAFTESTAEVVTFDNPITGGTSASTVYVARGLRRGMR